MCLIVAEMVHGSAKHVPQAAARGAEWLNLRLSSAKAVESQNRTIQNQTKILHTR